MNLQYSSAAFESIVNCFTTLCLGEGQEVQSVTFHQLRKNVTVLASALKNLGIKKGDRVVGMSIVFDRKPHLKLIWS